MNQVSVVEQLKELVIAQNASLRHKDTEIKNLVAANGGLVARVKELESENDALKSKLQKEGGYDLISRKIAQQNGDRNMSQASILNNTDPSADELYTTALSSPTVSKTSTASVDARHRITITLSSTPNSESKTLAPIKNYHDSTPKKTLTQPESWKAKRKSFYELSPDISDKHIHALENCYGGKQKANYAASVIQQRYRSWAMKRAYHRLRTQSEVRRSTSLKGHRTKRGSLRSHCSSSEDLSPISTLSIPFSLSLDSSDISLLSSDGKNFASPKTKPPEGIVFPSVGSPNDEFKAIKTDLDIDENFQPVEVSDKPGQVVIQRMSEDISSIEISKNLLNDSIGQQMIIDQVFQQILSPRKDSISLGGRLDKLRRSSDRKSKEEVDGKVEVAVLDSAVESTSFLPKEEDRKDEDKKEEDEKEEDKTEEDKTEEVQEEVRPTKEDVVSDEKPIDKETITDSDEHLPGKDHAGTKSQDSALVFGVIDSHSYSWPTLDQLVSDDSRSLGGNSLSPSSSIIQTFYEDKEKDIRIGVNHFNRKPKKGINFLIDKGVLDDDADSVCKFLREEPGISKQKIGEYLGDLRNPFSMEVLQSFVRSIDIQGKEVDEALRYFQTFFRMPGEAQKIERLVEEFSATYVEANPGKISDNPDTILVLSFAIIMLNTDLHSPNVKRKMTKVEFTHNLRGTNDGEDLPSETLSDIYDRIKKKQFKTGPDNLDAVLKYEKQILGKVPWTTLALPHRQLRQVTPLYEIQGGKKKEKAHHRIVFLFNDMIVITKERGQAGQKGVHFYSYKSSYSLCDIKFSLFNNNYYKYGVRLLNKSNSQVLISFHAKKEDIRKAFFTELRDCIDETVLMESERITCEKSRQLSGKHFGKRDLQDSLSMTLPHNNSQIGKNTPDSLSLMNEPATLPENELTASKLMSSSLMSSSLQDLTQTDGAYYEEPCIHKSNSVTSFDSAYVGSVSTESVWSHYQESTRSTPDFSPNGSPQHFPKRFGIFSSKRTKNSIDRKAAKSTGSLEDIKKLQRSVTENPAGQRKSEFFVKSPITT